MSPCWARGDNTCKCTRFSMDYATFLTNSMAHSSRLAKAQTLRPFARTIINTYLFSYTCFIFHIYSLLCLCTRVYTRLALVQCYLIIQFYGYCVSFAIMKQEIIDKKHSGFYPCIPLCCILMSDPENLLKIHQHNTTHVNK